LLEELSELVGLVSSSSESLSSDREVEGEVSFRESCGEDIGGVVSGLIMMVDSSFFRWKGWGGWGIIITKTAIGHIRV